LKFTRRTGFPACRPAVDDPRRAGGHRTPVQKMRKNQNVLTKWLPGYRQAAKKIRKNEDVLIKSSRRLLPAHSAFPTGDPRPAKNPEKRKCVDQKQWVPAHEAAIGGRGSARTALLGGLSRKDAKKRERNGADENVRARRGQVADDSLPLFSLRGAVEMVLCGRVSLRRWSASLRETHLHRAPARRFLPRQFQYAGNKLPGSGILLARCLFRPSDRRDPPCESSCW